MKRKAVRHLISLLHLVGFGLLVLVVRNMDWTDFGRLLRLYPLWKYAAGLAILCLVYGMKSYRWMILNRAGIHTTWSTSVVYYLSAGFLSVLTPGRLGEFAKVYFLKKNHQTSLSLATSAVFLDRIWDVLVLSLAAGMYLLWLAGDAGVTGWTLLLLVLLFAGSLVLVLRPGWLFRPLRRVTRRFPSVHGKLDDLFTLWESRRFAHFLPSLGISGAAFLSLAFIPVIFAMGTPYPLHLRDGIGAISVSNILSFLPITVAGFGTRELVFTTIWERLSYPVAAAISVSTVYFMVTYLGSLVIGGLVYVANVGRLFRWREWRSMRK
ncbi:MAG: lysylphosphatidylglycerol synthase transmembrane domain-containing protein [Bacteroidales bacterium]